MSIVWRIREKDFNLAEKGMIMGVLNVTPDSFSDGGRYFDVSAAVQHGLELVAEGADILDIGGESTRPGAAPVEVEEEIRRVVPVIQQLRAQTEVLISIDTMKAQVAEAAFAAGADILNDVNGLRDVEMIRAAATAKAAVIVMHMKGEPRTMQQAPVYENVVAEVRTFFLERLEALEKGGISREKIAFDPGIGFGKDLSHNLALLNALLELRVANCPLVLGVSRKSMIARLLEDSDLDKRHWPTVALTAWMRESGAEVIRVHEVKKNVEAMRMVEAIVNR